MNRINFLNTGGFPLETETLDALQQAYSIFNAFGDFLGDKVIVKGCQLTGSTVSDGYIYVDGELLEFRGGIQQTKIIIKEEVLQATYEDGNSHPTYYTRYACFGTGVNSMLWSDFNRIYPLSSALYIDKVDMYAGSLANIPAGWYLCDGSNGTVDLRGKFIVGYDLSDNDYDTVGNTGGFKEVSLTENELPSHNHIGTTDLAGNHNHSFQLRNDLNGSGNGEAMSESPNNDEGYKTYYTDQAGNHTHSFTTQNSGSNHPHENRPPYYSLAFIQFKGI